MKDFKIVKNKILHIMTVEKFLPAYIDFVDQHFGRTNHHYVFLSQETYKYGLRHEHNVEFLHTHQDIYETLLNYCQDARKIILHGLWINDMCIMLSQNLYLLEKAYWIMWGGDFYYPEKMNWHRKTVIKNVGYCICGTNGDYEFLKRWYDTKGKHIKCFCYPSNLYKDYDVEFKDRNVLNIQIGNSADPTNNHVDALSRLLKYKDENIHIFAPLSYGDPEYAKKIISIGSDFFGEKFIPLTNFLSFEKYMQFLTQIDIAVFNHHRQQGFGNIISLLGMGKKVYLNSQSTLNGLMKEYGLVVFDIDDLCLTLLEERLRKTNILNVQSSFSFKSLTDCTSLYLK